MDDNPFILPPSSSSSAGDMKTHLQSLLDAKEKQLQQAATLGQRVLAQQMELEERIRQLEELESEEDPEARDKLRELADTIVSWDTENSELSSGFASNRYMNGTDHSNLPQDDLDINATPRDDASTSAAERTKASSAAAQSRRAKNAAHRADDVEFAFEIGSGLLNEVRRLQSLLGERDKAIQDMKEEKDDMEASIETLRTALKQQEQSADKYKEENWNLEVTLQELRSSLADTQSDVARLEGESKRLTKQLGQARDSSESYKNQTEQLQTQLEELTAKHETDVALSRRHAAGLARDKSDLQQAIDTLKAEKEREKRRWGPGSRLFGSPATPNGAEANDFLTPGDRLGANDDMFSNPGASTNRRKGGYDLDEGEGGEVFGTGDYTPEASPIQIRSPNHPTNEIEALQQRLAHAQRQIATLKGTLQRAHKRGGQHLGEVSVRLEDDNEDEDGYEDVEEEGDTTVAAPAPKPRLTPARVGRGGARGRGRGRGRGGMTLTERLLAANKEEESELDDVVDDLSFDDDQVPAIEEPNPSPSRVSVDGMDPAFANVLKRTPSASSPLRESVLRRATRGGRGGHAWQEARPPSIVDQPEDLAAALGDAVGGSPVKVAIEPEPVREMAEFACQTDPEPEPPVVERAEMGVQIVPEPVLLPPAKVMADASLQTDAERVPATEEMAVQVNFEEPKPVLVDSGTGTDPVVFLGDMQTPTPRDRRTTLTQAQSIGQKRSFLLPVGGHETDEGEETETGAETELETEYEDARSAPATPSLAMRSRDDFHSMATGSRDDFHSMVTMTDVDFSGSDSDEDDGESIKASQISRPGTSAHVSRKSSMASQLSRKSVREPPVEYDSKAVEADLYALPPPPAPVEPPKPEMKEIATQTDSVPFPEMAPALYRVGAMGQPFQFIPPPPKKVSQSSSLQQPPVVPTPTSVVFRENSNGFTRTAAAPRTSEDSRRPSIDSISSVLDENAKPASALAPMVDKTKPPMMMLPPPPRAPPPPGSMPPPSFVPERRFADVPPPRPSSPPPPDLIQRATTPTFGSALSVPSLGGRMRQAGSSMPPSSQGLRQPSSTSSFRSAINPGSYNNHPASSLGLASAFRERDTPERRGMGMGMGMSTTSFVSGSPRSSVSSERPPILPTTPRTRQKMAELSGRSPVVNPTDPTVIHAITQTMIGEFLYKYTRKAIGKGHGQTRHKRFFWVHPYTRTLYWSEGDPGSVNITESSAKSAYVEGVRSVLDPNPMPPGLYQYSVVVSTPQREMKITAPTKERHDIWLNALKYLLSRPNVSNPAAPGNTTVVPESPISTSDYADEDHHMAVTASPQSQRSARSTTWNHTTPRGQRSRSQLSVRGSVGKRSGTPAAEYLRWQAPESPYSPTRSFIDVQGLDDEDLDFELHGDNHSDEGFEGLENVRACCDGKHTVGHAGGRHHHHHHHRHQSSDEVPTGPASIDGHLAAAHADQRPVSPSAWSFRSRSRSGSLHSQDGGTGLFSLRRGEDGKLRFGSRRSTKTVMTQS